MARLYLILMMIDFFLIPHPKNSMLRNLHTQQCLPRDREKLSNSLQDLYKNRIFKNGIIFNQVYSENQVVPDCFKHPNLFRKETSSLHLLGSKSKKDCYLPPRSRFLMDSTSCPWFFQLTRDRNRLPVVLLQAICRCKFCRDRQGYTLGRCKTVDIAYPILRRKSSRHAWEATIEYLSVACVCKRTFRRKKRHHSRRTRKIVHFFDKTDY